MTTFDDMLDKKMRSLGLVQDQEPKAQPDASSATEVSDLEKFISSREINLDTAAMLRDFVDRHSNPTEISIPTATEALGQASKDFAKGAINLKRSAQLGMSHLIGNAIGLFSPEFNEVFRATVAQDIGEINQDSITGVLGQIVPPATLGAAAALLAPVTGTVSAVGGVAGLFGASAAGAERLEARERRQSGQEITVTQEVSNAALAALTETVFEAFGTATAIRFGKAITKGLGSALVARSAGEVDAIEELIINGLKAAGVNSAEESATTLIQNSSRLLTGVAPDQDITEGLAQSALAGAVTGPAIALTTGGLGALSESRQRARSSADEAINTTIQEGQEQTVQIQPVEEPDGFLVDEIADPNRSEVVTDEIVSADEPIISANAREETDQIVTTKIGEDEVVRPELPPPPPREGSKLPGGREAGGTIIPQAMARRAGDEIVSLSKTFAQKVVDSASDIKKIIKKNLSTGVGFIETLGDTGKKIGRETREIDLAASKRAKTMEVEIRELLRNVSSKDRQIIAKTINGESSLSGKKVPESLKQRANRLREILDNGILFPAKEVGMTRRLRDGSRVPVGGKGKAFPQVPNAEGRKVLDLADKRGLSSPRVYRVAQKMVDDGRAVTKEDALAILRTIKAEQIRGTVPYLESVRTELPPELVEWDPNHVLPAVIERASLAIEGVRKWGDGFDTLNKDLAILETEQDSALVNQIERFFKQEFGVSNHVTPESKRLAGNISNYETTVRLGGSIPSAIRNVTQRVNNTVSLPISAVAKANIEFPPFINPFLRRSRQLKNIIEKSGVVRNASDLANIETGLVSERITQIALKPFTQAETGNQVATALAARHALEQDIERIIRLEGHNGPTSKVMNGLLGFIGKDADSIRRRLDKRGISSEDLADVVASGGRLTEDQINAFANRVVLDTQFALTLATKPLWWSTNPWLRLAFKFKTFGLRQTTLIYNDVLKEMFKGNVAPFAKFAIFMVMSGELYNIMRDYLTNREESITSAILSRPDEQNLSDLSARAMADFMDGGGFGLLADVTYGFSDFVGGPVASTLKNVGEFAMDIWHRKTPTQTLGAIRNLSRNEVSVIKQTELRELIDKKLLNENNNILAHQKWRRRAFDFKKETDDETKADELVRRTIEGFKDFGRGKNTLIYEFAARQISVGDVDDAAEYLADIYKDARNDPRKLRRLISGTRNSKTSKSPLGPIPQKDHDSFLSQFNKNDRKEAVDLQRKFLRDYESAIRKAIAMSRKD